MSLQINDHLNCHFTVLGVVQGIGFRPFVFQIAKRLGLTGWVCNTKEGISGELSGSRGTIDQFFETLRSSPPYANSIEEISSKTVQFRKIDDFHIAPSQSRSDQLARFPLDTAICSECVKEFSDPASRRYQYPFITCAQCGPRFTITNSLPFDRENTAMKNFPICSTCQTEYTDPTNRRFHAQTISCPDCGPHLKLMSRHKDLAYDDEAINRSVDLLRSGGILAVKGIGGYQLVVDAENSDAIQELRRRKNRPEKPFALMVKSTSEAKKIVMIDQSDQCALESPANPIVLLKKNDTAVLAHEVAFNLAWLGIMLPSSGLHLRLLSHLNRPLIVTSGNCSHEPICITEIEALERLGAIADVFLTHDRDIYHMCDDSILKPCGDRMIKIRLGRGYAPLYLNALANSQTTHALGVGGQFKNTFAITTGKKIVVSQHIGDMDSLISLQRWSQEKNFLMSEVINSKNQLQISCDLHPDYVLSAWAEKQATYHQLQKVQHHVAHFAAALAEQQLTDDCIGVIWDGSGYGNDRTIWGGEFFLHSQGQIHRIASFLPFPLLGGERAIIEPRRCALALLMQAFDTSAVNSAKLNLNLATLSTFSQNDLANIDKIKQLSPTTSSVGRLFDGVAALINVCQKQSFEAQAAMLLESLATDHSSIETYPFEILHHDTIWRIDWRPMIRSLVQDILDDASPSQIATRFHTTLCHMTNAILKKEKLRSIVFNGGAFQNSVLVKTMMTVLRDKNNYLCYLPDALPPNDSGISLGQVTRSGYPP